MIKQRRPIVDHGVRKGDRANPHKGDCTGTLCPVCGCCMHCTHGPCESCADLQCSCGVS